MTEIPLRAIDIHYNAPRNFPFWGWVISVYAGRVLWQVWVFNPKLLM